MKIIEYNKANVEKYKSKDNLLRHARTGKGITGVMMVTENGELIGYIGWSGNMIISLEVTKGYRGRGYGEELLRMAMKEGCYSLTVDPNNVIAQNLYKKLGFKRVEDRLWKAKLYTLTMNEEEFRLYSEFQKEFGLASDLYHSGIKRTGKKYIGRFRKHLAENSMKRLIRSAERQREILKEYENASVNQSISDKRIQRALVRKANGMNARVLDVHPGILTGDPRRLNSAALPAQKIDPRDFNELDRSREVFEDLVYLNRITPRLNNEISSGKTTHLVLHKSDVGNEVLAHELGHLGNELEGSIIHKTINDLSKKRRKTLPSISQIIYESPTSPLDRIKERIFEGALVLEEGNANKRGLRYLKDLGVSNEELKEIKKRRELALETYRNQNRMNRLSRKYKSLQIPSRSRNLDRLQEDVQSVNLGKRMKKGKDGNFYPVQST